MSVVHKRDAREIYEGTSSDIRREARHETLFNVCSLLLPVLISVIVYFMFSESRRDVPFENFVAFLVAVLFSGQMFLFSMSLSAATIYKFYNLQLKVRFDLLGYVTSPLILVICAVVFGLSPFGQTPPGVIAFMVAAIMMFASTYFFYFTSVLSRVDEIEFRLRRARRKSGRDIVASLSGNSTTSPNGGIDAE